MATYNTTRTLLERMIVNQQTQINNYFEFISSFTRPANTTAYAVNQAVSPGSNMGINLGFINRMIQIDEINMTDNNTNAPLLTPTIYFSEDNTYVNWADQSIPVTLNQSSYLDKMEVVVGTVLIKIPGSANNCNILKSPILNLNIKLKTDASGYIYWGMTTTSIFTPISGERISVIIKGKYL